MQRNINRLGAALALTFWMVHAYFDSLLSTEGITFLESCFYPNVESFLVRGFVVLLLLISFAYTERLSNSFNRKAGEFKRDHEQLEHRVNRYQIEMDERLEAIKRLEQLADTDPLTSIYNRRKFRELLRYETQRNHRYHIELSLIMCDIDHFKRINDRYGHDTGDHVLKVFAETITANIREIDIFARWGGEEFMILMPNANLDCAVQVAEKLRALIETTEIGGVNHFTASFGVTEFNKGDTVENFIKRADDALYRAKESGRNTVVSVAQNPSQHLAAVG